MGGPEGDSEIQWFRDSDEVGLVCFLSSSYPQHNPYALVFCACEQS